MAVQNVVFIRRLRRAAPVTEDELLRVFAGCRGAYRVSDRVRLLETDAVRSPAVCGIFRPKILLPSGLAGGFSREEIRYVFLHELAHVKRRDLAVHWLATLLQVLHWFNPVVWYGFRRMAADREMACDELALLQGREEERQGYGETIIKLLDNLPRPAALPGVVGILEDKNQMRRRIATIAGFRRRRRWSLLAIVVAGALAAIGLTDARTDRPGGTAADRADLTGRITDQSGEPIAGASVFIHTAAPREGPATLCPSCYADCTKKATTDAGGRFRIESLDPELIFNVAVAATGFRAEIVERVDPFQGELEAALRAVTAADAPAHRIRGRVVDPAGRTVSGAVVRVLGVTQNDRTWIGRYPGFDPLAIAGENGEFVIHSQEAFEEAGFRVEARGFALGNFPRHPAGDEVHELELTEGVSLTGRVMKNGIPLAGVEIGTMGAARSVDIATGLYSVATDENGHFLFVNLPPQREYLIYGIMDSLGEHGAIPLQRVRMDPAASAFGTTLHPIVEPLPSRVLDDGSTYDMGDLPVERGHVLAGRIQLTDGQPVPENTRVRLSRPDARDSLETRTDAEGRFRFDGVPEEAVTLSAPLPGYRLSLRNASLEPRYRSSLLGRIQGDKTDLIVELEPGPRRERGEGDPDALRERALQGVEEMSEEAVLVGGPAGVVLTPGGEPADGAIVHLLAMEGNRTLQIQGEKVEIGRSYPGARKTVTDSAGRFSFAPGEDSYGVIAIAEEGYAEATMEELAASEISLRPWTRVEGELRVGADPAVNETIRLGPVHLPYQHYPRRVPPLSLFLQTTTDGDGNFVFERVPPIHLRLSHSPDVRDRSSGTIPQSQTVHFTATPGETHRIILGGTGRPVVGRLVVKGHEEEIEWRAEVHSLRPVVSRPEELLVPGDAYRAYQAAVEEATSDAEKEKARIEYERHREEEIREIQAFYASDAGREYRFAQGAYALNMSPDGRFRIEDVPGGRYTLRVRLGEQSFPELSGREPHALIWTKEIEVPESPNGRTDEPFDAGVFELFSELAGKEFRMSR